MWLSFATATTTPIIGVETDIPLYPGCLEIETLDGSPVEIPANAPFVAGACIDISPQQTGSLPHRQFDLLQLHHARTNSDGSVTVEALPQVHFPGQLDCDGYAEVLGSERSSGLIHLAKRGWKMVQGAVGPWFSPPPLTAGDRGVGGEMFGGDAFSPAVWGLPVQMERGQMVGGQFVPWNDIEIGEVGTALMPAVRVLDAGTLECDPNDDDCHLEEPQPVADATVAFDVTAGTGVLSYGPNTVFDVFGSRTKVLTGTDGIAFAYLDPSAGQNAAEAVGVGIGCSTFDVDGGGTSDCQITDGNPPPSPASDDGTGPFGDNALFRPRTKMDIATGVTSFNGFACSPRPALLAADAEVKNGEYPAANSDSFTAKLSGGEVPAKVYWTNDCTDLYVAVTVQTYGEGDNPPVRLVFDNNDDGFEELGDDILFLDRSEQSVKGTKVYTWSFSDRFLSQDCLADNAKSDCGDADPADLQEGEAYFSFVPGADGMPGLATYEFRHKLDSGDADHDLELSFSAPNNQVGFNVVFQTGQGPKGGTIYPGLAQYISIAIAP